MLHQSNTAKMRTPVPTAGAAAVLVHAVFEFVADKAIAAADIIEIGAIPAHNEIVSAELLADNTAATTFDVGLLSGDFGVKDDARALVAGKNMLTAAGSGGKAAATATLLALGQTDKDRAIGVKPSAAIAYSAGTPAKIRLVVTYKA